MADLSAIVIASFNCKENSSFDSKQTLFDQVIWGNIAVMYGKCLDRKAMMPPNSFFLKDVLLPVVCLNPAIQEILVDKTNYFRDFTLINKIFRKFHEYRSAEIQIVLD